MFETLLTLSASVCTAQVEHPKKFAYPHCAVWAPHIIGAHKGLAFDKVNLVEQLFSLDSARRRAITLRHRYIKFL